MSNKIIIFTILKIHVYTMYQYIVMCIDGSDEPDV